MLIPFFLRGKKSGVTHFLLGALYGGGGAVEQDTVVVRSVARVGSGYSAKELFELMQKVMIPK